MVADVGQEALLSQLLARSVRELAPLEQQLSTASGELGSLQDRLAHGRFHLAVLGQFKRGKSTLVNALLGLPLLPTAVVPLTAIPTLLEPADQLALTIRFNDGREPARQVPPDPAAAAAAAVLERYVTETGNPENRLEVAQVEVAGPFELLRRGVVMIDTPGIGSTLGHNTATTVDFLPQCDAALFVLSADPPITAAELEFLRDVREKVADVLFVLNKVDYLAPEDRLEAIAYLTTVLQDQAGLAAPRIFPVSARDALAAAATKDPARREASGVAALEAHLTNYLAREKARTLAMAIARKAAVVLGNIESEVHLTVRALELPLHDLAERLAIFEGKLAEIEAARLRLQDALAGDSRRLHQFLEEHAEQLRTAARQYLRQVVDEAVAVERSGTLDEELVAARLKDTIPRYFARLREDSVATMRHKLDSVLVPHRGLADALVEAVRQTAAELFELPLPEAGCADVFELLEQPYWVKEQWSARLSPLAQNLAERLLPRAIREQKLRDRLGEQVEALVVRNVENLRWALYQSLDHTLRRFATEVDGRLAETVRSTHGAILAAMRQRTERTSSIEAAIRPWRQVGRAVAEVRPCLLELGRLTNGQTDGQAHATNGDGRPRPSASETREVRHS